MCIHMVYRTHHIIYIYTYKHIDIWRGGERERERERALVLRYRMSLKDSPCVGSPSRPFINALY